MLGAGAQIPGFLLAESLSWAPCMGLSLPSLCVGDSGDTAAGDRDTNSVTDTMSLHRTCRGERVQGWVTSYEADNSILGSGGCCEGWEEGLKKPTEPGAWQRRMFSTHSVLCFSSEFVRDFCGSECHLRGTASTFCRSQRCPRSLLPAGDCSPMPNTAQSLPGCCHPPAAPPGVIPSHSLRAELGLRFCKCERESDGMTLPWGVSQGYAFLPAPASLAICFHLSRFDRPPKPEVKPGDVNLGRGKSLCLV